MDDDEDIPPFWLQNTDNRRRRRRHLRQQQQQQPSSLFFHTGIVIITLLVIAFAFIFVIIPPFLSFISKIFNPHLVKKTWDSVNLVLVLFAVICGFLSQSSSRNDNNGVVIIILLVIAFAFVFVIIPSFLSFTYKIFRPHLVKKTWDSVNLVLVLFAVICGFLSQSNSQNDNSDSRSTFDEDYKFSGTPKHVRDRVGRSNLSTPRQWYHYSSSDRTGLRRMRSSSSYPDLRQESSWMMNGDDHDRRRFFDDDFLYNYRGWSRRKHDREEAYINNISVDSVQTSSPPTSSPQPASPPPATIAATAASPPPPPPRQLPEIVRRKPTRTYDYEDLKPKEENKPKEDIYSGLKIKHSLSPPPPAAQPSPSPPSSFPPPKFGLEKRSNKSGKKRGRVTKELLIPLRREKKRQRQRSVENLDEFLNLSTLPLNQPASPLRLPPPPLALPSFYHESFSSKKRKTRKKHSVRPLPPLSTPPLESRASKREPQKSPVATQKPPLPVNERTINNVGESVESSSESLLNQTPQPPPPPPFKIKPWKYEHHGDFVRLKSFHSSPSSSPDVGNPHASQVTKEPRKSPLTTQKPPLPVNIGNINKVGESVESSSESLLNQTPQPPPPPPFKIKPWKYEQHGDFVRLKSFNCSQSSSPGFDNPLSRRAHGNKMGETDHADSMGGTAVCPSPDVNTKAEDFIERFRADLKLEKINSVKRRLNLGPHPGPSAR